MLRSITRIALAAIALAGGAAVAPTPAAAAPYLHVFNACDVEPGVYVGPTYGPSNYGPNPPGALVTFRTDSFYAFGGQGNYRDARTVSYARDSATVVRCWERHYSKAGAYCDDHVTVSGSDASHSFRRTSRVCP